MIKCSFAIAEVFGDFDNYTTITVVKNYITGGFESIDFNNQTAERYGILCESNQLLQLDIKTVIERFLDFAKSAGIDITNNNQNGNDDSIGWIQFLG